MVKSETEHILNEVSKTQWTVSLVLNLHLLLLLGCSLVSSTEKFQNLQDIVEFIILNFVKQEAYDTEGSDDDQSQFGKLSHLDRLVKNLVFVSWSHNEEVSRKSWTVLGMVVEKLFMNVTVHVCVNTILSKISIVTESKQISTEYI